MDPMCPSHPLGRYADFPLSGRTPCALIEGPTSADPPTQPAHLIAPPASPPMRPEVLGLSLSTVYVSPTEAIDSSIFAWGYHQSSCAHCSRPTAHRDRDRVAFCGPTCRRLHTRRIEFSHAHGITYSRPYRTGEFIAFREALAPGYDGWASTETVIAEHCLIDPDTGCWYWLGGTETSGYADGGGGLRLVHRHALAAYLGLETLGAGTVHHTCPGANRLTRRCLAPEHLQIVSRHENVAEMIERTAYRSAIELLSDALRALDPEHPALDRAAKMAA